MEDRRRLIVIWSVVLIVVVAVFWFFASREESYNWNETYNNEGMQPYDLGLFKKVLKESKGERFEILEGLLTDTSYLKGKGDLLVLVQGFALIDTVEAEYLEEFARNGNTVLISTNTAGAVMKRLSACENDSITGKKSAEEVKINAKGKVATLSFDRYNEPVNYGWTYFLKPYCGEIRGKIAMGGGDFPNMLELKVGDGSVIIHCTPLLFTNYHFRNEEVFDYVGAILSDSESSKVYYLEPSPFTLSSGKPGIAESPLRFILSHPPLKWAWYLILLTALAFVLNGVRRKRRAIPFLKLPENQTKAFVDMVYRLYRKEGSHRDIIRIQDKHLRLFLRNKYGINTNEWNKETHLEVTEKLKMDQAYVAQFFEQLKRSRYNSTLTESEFLEIDKKITEFYLRCP